ncbi:ABA4-like family protein [Actinophytocola sediminis]
MISTLFASAFWVATPFWALMVLAPTWRWTGRIVSSPWIVAPTLVVWVIAAFPLLGPLWSLVTQPTLAATDALLTDPRAITVFWAQIIAWDLFVGRWMYLDSRRRGVHPLIMAPVLVFTILLSPIGLPAYLVLRSVVPTADRQSVDTQ